MGSGAGPAGPGQGDAAGIQVQAQAGQVPAAPSALAVPRQLVELVNADLRGRISTGDRERLTEDPQRWLGVLGSVLQSVRDQISDRAKNLDVELARPERSVAWDEIKRQHNEWLRKARHFERMVNARIDDVRRLVPDDDVCALLHDGAQIDPTTGEGAHAWFVWQARARRALLARSSGAA